jgi:hypothetical protein
MRLALTRHPESRCEAVARIDVDVARPRPDTLTLGYRVTGKIGNLRLPPRAAPTRADRLWTHTCFEAFVRASPGGAYFELNFAPSTRWAAYGFDGYRSGMRIAHEISASRIEVQSSPERYRMVVTVTLGGLPGAPSDASWRLGLAAVIEETSGRASHWALAHPPGKADFHHSDCFAHGLPAPCAP